MKIEQTDGRMTLKGGGSFAVVGVMAFAMGTVGILLFVDMLRSAGEPDSNAVLGAVIAAVWTLLTFSMGVCAFAAGSRTLTLDDGGVTAKTWFRRSFLPWSEVNDWGLSYRGRDRWGSNFYDLYFSREIYPARDECRKKLRGRMLRITIDNDGYTESVARVIPFCSSRTAVTPFVGVDKMQLL